MSTAWEWLSFPQSLFDAVFRLRTGILQSLQHSWHLPVTRTLEKEDGELWKCHI